jgi:4-amino-4-deoxychorismate lyase
MLNLVNGAPDQVVSVHDRGLTYGDGVFRTMVVRDGKPLHWPRHYEKLASDCRALDLPCPARGLFDHDLQVVGEAHRECVARLVLTRGTGARGYQPPASPTPTRIVTSHPLPTNLGQRRQQGVHVHMCRVRIAVQPALAGIKHLNRLENVLAQAEWSGNAAVAEGVMLDADGNVAGGTMSNLFLAVDGGLITPRVDRCGVAGVQRQRVMELARANAIPAREDLVRIDQLLAADEVFLVNSVISLWPVAGMGSKRWELGPIASKMTVWLEETQH